MSLRGASAKEQTRDELLDRVAQERAIRSHAKQHASSALVIQVRFTSKLHEKESPPHVKSKLEFFLKY